jgi:SulP family sulfate permease
LMVATLMAGAILVAMGLLRLGNLIQFIPHPVTTGFTAGIGVTIAVLQLGDFLGLGPLEGDRIWERISDLVARFAQSRWPDLAIGLFALALMIFFPKLTKRVPAPLVAVAAAAVAGVLMTAGGSDVTTITTRFGGIPAVPPAPVLPWTIGEGTGWALVPELAPTAVAIAMLGAIESLLCAVVADGMTGSRHDPDSELLGLGLGNLVVPFFGGFAATDRPYCHRYSGRGEDAAGRSHPRRVPAGGGALAGTAPRLHPDGRHGSAPAGGRLEHERCLAFRAHASDRPT